MIIDASFQIILIATNLPLANYYIAIKKKDMTVILHNLLTHNREGMETLKLT